MRRRDFIKAIVGSALTCPHLARAQQNGRIRRIAALMPFTATDAQAQARNAAFLQGLQQLGWTVGRNIQIDYRWSAGNVDDTRKYASELVALAPDIIFVPGSSAVAPLLQVTRSIPVVFTMVADPVGSGFVTSPVASRRQRHGFHDIRVRHWREVAGSTQATYNGPKTCGGHTGSLHHCGNWPVGRYPIGGAVVRGGIDSDQCR
jgi:hypothetical protein